MTEHETFPGNPYVVTSKAGCTITDASGELEETCEAGKQKVIFAPSEKLFTSAPAIVRETFKRAASVLRLLGGGVDKWGKYALCTTNEEMAAINADYRNDVDKNGLWAWKLPNIKNFTVRYDGNYLTSGLCRSNAKKVKLILPNIISIDSICREMPELEEAVLVAPLANNHAVHGFSGCGKLKKAHVELQKLYYMSALFEGCPALEEVSGVCGVMVGTYCGGSKLKHWRLELPNIKQCYQSNLCLNAQLTKESALFLLGTIPAWNDGGSHSIGIGVHVDHQTDEEVINAIAEAEAKGWTLTVKWNGTATAATASTWGRRKPIFAKLVEPNEDGTPCLNWGHYVTNAEENGYTEFASLEEAKEHFNITD